MNKTTRQGHDPAGVFKSAHVLKNVRQGLVSPPKKKKTCRTIARSMGVQERIYCALGKKKKKSDTPVQWFQMGLTGGRKVRMYGAAVTFSTSTENKIKRWGMEQK